MSKRNKETTLTIGAFERAFESMEKAFLSESKSLSDLMRLIDACACMSIASEARQAVRSGARKLKLNNFLHLQLF